MQTYKPLYKYTATRKDRQLALYIYKRVESTETVVLKYIGELADLRIEIVGGDSALDTAIMKTALHMALEDSHDVAETRITVQEQTGPRIYPVKHGGWNDLYTPDATLYKVVLFEGSDTRWSGYLTPDAWEEDLTYHMPLHLTARDNIGHLDDMDFDMEGMVSVESVITTAMQKAELAMTLDLNIDDLKFVDSAGTLRPASQAYVNAEGLRDKSWYQALEAVLDSFGLVLRYIDNNTVAVRTLRAWSMDSAMQRQRRDLLVTGRSGHLTKSPAYRSISERWTPDSDGYIFQTRQKADDYTPIASTAGNQYYGPSASSVWSASGSLRMVNPFAMSNPSTARSFYPEPGTALFLQAFESIAASVGNPNIYRSVRLNGAPVQGVFRLTFDIAPCSPSGEDHIVKHTPSDLVTTTAVIAIRGVKNGSTVYFNPDNGLWESSFKTIRPSGQSGQASAHSQRVNNYSVDYSTELPMHYVDQVTVMLYGFTVTTSNTTIINQRSAGNLFVYVSRCELSQAETDFPERIVNTIYDAKQNQQLRREPELGELNFTVLSPEVVKNGIYHMGSDGTMGIMNRWRYDGPENRPLPVLIHQGILTFHAKANNVVTGTMVAQDQNSPKAGDMFVYQGVRYLLAGGSIDLFSGMIENAVLREYGDYAAIWGEADRWRLGDRLPMILSENL